MKAKHIVKWMTTKEMHIESKLIRGKHLINLKIVYIPIKTIQLEVFF